MWHRCLGRETMDDSEVGVGDLAALYLGNILYAIERAAMTLEQEGKVADAAFYRGIARKLAEARGKERGTNG